MPSTLRVGLVFIASLFFLHSVAARAAETATYNRIHLQTQTSGKVDNDRMQAVMSVFGEDRDTAKLADRLNSTMAWALDSARKFPGVTISSGQYQTFPVFDKDTLKRWRSTQELSLESNDAKQLTRLLSVLQERLQLTGTSFTVSESLRARAEDALIDKALDAFKARAERIRKNLRAKTYRIVDLNIGSNAAVIPPYSMMRSEALASTVAAPAVEAGASTFTITADGTIELQY